PFISDSGITYADDMKLLKQVFRSRLREHGFAEGSPDAQAVSQATMSLFSAGGRHRGIHAAAEFIAEGARFGHAIPTDRSYRSISRCRAYR
ncbi:hypothetical protein LB543_30840, partial [Mesorhizobium sp. ESP7-2]|uniref:hypothetical protein n=1 Tax=Mesorhizobium sp. ESP7-2 TaxID=2876622 RepID=UPI001CCC7A31